MDATTWTIKKHGLKKFEWLQTKAHMTVNRSIMDLFYIEEGLKKELRK